MSLHLCQNPVKKMLRHSQKSSSRIASIKMKHLIYWGKLTLLVFLELFICDEIRCQTTFYLCTQNTSLFSSNPNICKSNIVGKTGVSILDIALCPNGNMYGCGQKGGGKIKLYKIDTSSANITLVGLGNLPG